MKKSNQNKRGVQDPGQQPIQQPEKAGWIRKFCGRGIFRELWRNRYVVLRGDHLYISDKEVKDERKAQEVFDLADYERSEELRKAKSRSKKNHSRFTVLRCRQPGNTVPNLIFLAVSPEEKESWINAINMAIIRAKNRVFDEVTVDDDQVLVHPTRDRARVPYGRRLPTRGHLAAVASSHRMLTLDLVAEEDCFFPQCHSGIQKFWENSFHGESSCGSRGFGCRQRAGTDVSKLRVTSKEPRVKTGSLPRGTERSWCKQPHLEAAQFHKTQQSQTPQPGKRFTLQGRSRCASLDEVLSSRPAMIRSELRSALRYCPTKEEGQGGASVQPVGQLQSLIAQRMQRAQELLEEMRLQELQKAKAERERANGSPYLKSLDSPRLHHLRGSESPHSSRSSGSQRSRSSDSPRLRGKESPRSKVKRNRSKGTDSPRSRGSRSPISKANTSPRLGASPHLSSSDAPPTKHSGASKLQSSACSSKDEDLPESGFNAAHDDGFDQTDFPQLRSEKESPCQSENFPSVSGSCESSQSKIPDSLSSLFLASPSAPLTEEELEVERRRAEAERLLEEAMSSWKEAQEVLQEVKELQSQTLRRQRRKTYEKTTSTAARSPTATGGGNDTDEEESETA
ncbi:pleckstrin homology domain-containing family O member 1-A [Thalassophryne amazonica]|uniref:pleckstrin homology domain-containing family O member 1-A n=1 Tax=Thalassophryne amazonica TaxID=390379 RepID=UPI00147201C3|nr:pleckstrin homology domain-containing family O member 1-A [Thalassophryne amazonica]